MKHSVTLLCQLIYSVMKASLIYKDDNTCRFLACEAFRWVRIVAHQKFLNSVLSFCLLCAAGCTFFFFFAPGYVISAVYLQHSLSQPTYVVIIQYLSHENNVAEQVKYLWCHFFPHCVRTPRMQQRYIKISFFCLIFYNIMSTLSSR